MTDQSDSLDAVLAAEDTDAPSASEPVAAVVTDAPAASTDAAVPAAITEPTTPAPVATDAGQPRGPDGKFAPKVETPAVVAAPVVAAIPAAIVPTDRPLTGDDVKAIIEERHKRQEAEGKFAAAEARAKALEERLQQRDAQPIPSPSLDPDGFAASMHDQVQRAALTSRFDTSELFSRQAHGDPAVDAAMAWGMEKSNSSQAFATEYVAQRNPIDWIVKQHKRDQIMSAMGDDPDKWAIQRAAELAATAQPNVAAATPVAPVPVAAQPAPRPAIATPSPSLASAPNAGGASHVPDGAMSLDDLIKP